MIFQVKMIRHNFDFIKVNGRNARHFQTHRAPSLSSLDDLKKKDEEQLADYCRGEVPK